MGFTTMVHPVDPAGFEAVWRQIEDRLPAAFDKVEAGTAVTDPVTVDLLRNCLAVHMARTKDLIALHEGIWRVWADRNIDALAQDRRTAESFRRNRRGLVPVGPEALRQEGQAIVGRSVAAIEASSFRADRMLELYREARKRLARVGLEIGVADSGEFLISDAPAQTLRAGSPGVGFLRGVAWGNATTIIMPIGRRHLLAVGAQNAYLHLDRTAVDYLNRCQVQAAHEFVAWHPDADLRGFVEAAQIR